MSTLPFSPYFDLVTPDGVITAIEKSTPSCAKATVQIERIPSLFVGFDIDEELIDFNLKSTLAQLGLTSELEALELDRMIKSATLEVKLIATDWVGEALLSHLRVGTHVGRLFAADDRRRVRDPTYLARMFGRVDREGNALLSLGTLPGSEDLILEKIEGRAIAYLSLQRGTYTYKEEIEGLLPTIVAALVQNEAPTRDLVRLNQHYNPDTRRVVESGKQLLVRTLPLHIRTVFARVAADLLPEGVYHTSANILEPTTQASGDIYELFGSNKEELNDIPLEFYTLEPYREHVFFSDRDQLQHCLENPQTLFEAFETAPLPRHHKSSVFIVKSSQLKALEPSDWVSQESDPNPFPGIFHAERQAIMVDRYIRKQPCYPFLEAIQNGLITSQGVLLTRFFPSPVMKRMLLGELVQRCLKGIYFELPSRSSDEYFSHEDRGHLLDLAKFAIPVYWVDRRTGKILQYVPKNKKDAGMFVPLDRVNEFANATAIGIYGSNLIEIDLEDEIEVLLKGLLDMRSRVDHPLLNSKTPLALVTGGGPGAMLVGNKASRNVGVLSCANIVDFTAKGGTIVHEQTQNPYIEAKMTYRLERLVERQAEFHLDLPIILLGGMGTDFELSLEEVRRKVGVIQATPIILFGPPEYWRDKITFRFQRNLKEGTIVGSEWISNCFYCVQNAKAALKVYFDYFTGRLPIGKNGPIYKEGFKVID